MAESGFHFDAGAMGKKIGGVPVWGVGVSFAALFVAILYVRNRNKYRQQAAVAAAATPGGTDLSASSPDPNAYDAMYGLPNGPVGNWLSQNPTFAGYPVGLGNSGLPSPITNAQWSRQIYDQIVSTGADPTLVANALSKYLSGQTLSQAEQAIVDLALKQGAPPEGIAPVITTPTPAKPRGLVYTALGGQNFDTFMKKYGYGTNWTPFFNANPDAKVIAVNSKGDVVEPGGPDYHWVFAGNQQVTVPDQTLTAF